MRFLAQVHVGRISNVRLISPQFAYIVDWLWDAVSSSETDQSGAPDVAIAQSMTSQDPPEPYAPRGDLGQFVSTGRVEPCADSWAVTSPVFHK